MKNLHRAGACRTGIEALDHEHLQLIETIDQTCASLGHGADSEPVLDALGVLYMRTCAHLALEQKLARERSLEFSAADRRRRDALLDRIRMIMDSFEDGRCEQCDRSLADCLMSWMGQHLRSRHAAPAGARIGLPAPH
jgi:hemerythrin-like metal-binding protein